MKCEVVFVAYVRQVTVQPLRDFCLCWLVLAFVAATAKLGHFLENHINIGESIGHAKITHAGLPLFVGFEIANGADLFLTLSGTQQSNQNNLGSGSPKAISFSDCISTKHHRAIVNLSLSFLYNAGSILLTRAKKKNRKDLEC
ncbi:hypothetical protein VNO77_13464 [Canavalia gladiata]|uniref:Uncharacterized protein n=1 Tax=Canavalia gladiata TaxID=3824 RepID=A0AAN9QUZ7_CANGL